MYFHGIYLHSIFILCFQISIAYFPMIVLISGVFASFAGKKLNKLLGNKVNTISNVFGCSDLT